MQSVPGLMSRSDPVCGRLSVLRQCLLADIRLDAKLVAIRDVCKCSPSALIQMHPLAAFEFVAGPKGGSVDTKFSLTSPTNYSFWSRLKTNLRERICT